VFLIDCLCLSFFVQKQISLTLRSLSLCIFHIFLCLSLFSSPAFHHQSQLTYIIIYLGGLAIGLYKLSTMKLIPTAAADFQAYVTEKEFMQESITSPSIY
jgi:hypothetical protein